MLTQMYTEVHCISAPFHVPHKRVWMGGGRQGVTIVHTSVFHANLCSCASLSTAVSLLPPQVKGTYLVVYGPLKTFLLVLVLVLMGAVSSYLLELHHLLWPLQGLMLGVGADGGRGGGRGSVK